MRARLQRCVARLCVLVACIAAMLLTTNIAPAKSTAPAPGACGGQRQPARNDPPHNADSAAGSLVRAEPEREGPPRAAQRARRALRLTPAGEHHPCINNVRRLRGGRVVTGSGPTPPSDMGGYRYSAFGKTYPADTTTPAPMYNGAGYSQPLRWQARWYDPVAGGLYDVRARQWSPELGAFLQVDDFVFLTRSSTLWSWPGQNPYRWRDPSGQFLSLGSGAAGGIAAEAIAAGEAAAAGTIGAAAVGLVGGFAVGWYVIAPALLDPYFDSLKDAQLREIAADLAEINRKNRENAGKPNPGKRCQTETGGAGTKPPAGPPGDVADEFEDDDGRPEKPGIRRKPGSLGKFKGTDALRRENNLPRAVAKKLGLNPAQRRALHREISAQGLTTYDEVMAVAKSMFGK